MGNIFLFSFTSVVAVAPVARERFDVVAVFSLSPRGRGVG
jgi:hypothetical protein